MCVRVYERFKSDVTELTNGRAVMRYCSSIGQFSYVALCAPLRAYDYSVVEGIWYYHFFECSRND